MAGARAARLVGTGLRVTPVSTGVTRNPVPTSLAARRPGGRHDRGGVPLIRTPRTLPRVLSPAAVDALVGALRTALST